MVSHHPNKRTVFIAIICMIIVGGTYAYTTIGPHSVSDTKKLLLETKPDDIVSSEDWRAQFINSTSAPITHSKITTNQSPSTLTEKLGVDFFARYIQLHQSGLIDNQQLVESAVNQSIYSATQSAEKAKIYSLHDISISSANTETSLKIYGNAVADIFSRYGSDGDVADIANSAFDNADMSLLVNLEPVADSYSTIASEIGRLTVPQPLVTHHINLLNSLSKIELAVRTIRKLDIDPIQAMVSINDYANIHESVVESLIDIKTYLSNAQIQFGPTEPGSIFVNLQ